MVGTKEKLLGLLEENRGAFFSGEELGEKLSLSRTAVWKAVNALRGEGYEIKAVPNKGYSLSVDTDILSAQGIQKYLESACAGLQLSVLPTAPSTNTLAREAASHGALEGYTVVANNQTGGRGRAGRSFFSPANTGIYLSILLRPEHWVAEQAIKLTTMAAVAACEAMDELAMEKAWIKWVNDIYMRGKKVSGILTEASFGLENGFLEYAVLGIGINAYPPEGGFPGELEGIAGAVFPESQRDGKNRLCAGFLNHFMAYYLGGGQAGYVEKYRERSLVVGRDVLVISPSCQRKAVALDVDKDCRLLVQYEDGKTERLSSGEISVKLPAGVPL